MTHEESIFPTAMSNNSWQMWTVSILYLLVSTVAAIGVLRLLFTKTSAWYRLGALSSTAVHCVLRGVLTMVTVKNWQQHMWLAYLLNLFLPVYLQFLVFSLLVLFVGKVHCVVATKEPLFRSTIQPAFFAMHCVLVAGFAFWSYQEGQRYSSKHQSRWDKIPALGTGLLYGLLAVGGGLCLVQAHTLKNLLPADTAVATPPLLSTPSRLSRHDRGQGRIYRYLILIGVFVLIFALRCAWNLSYYAGENPIQVSVLPWDGDYQFSNTFGAIQDRISDWIQRGDTTAFEWAFLIFYSVCHAVSYECAALTVVL